MAVIELEGLTKEYGSILAADDLTFDVEEGEIFGYLGPNGAGKTTTIRMLLGFISPTSGTARVLGSDIRDRRALLDARRRVGYLSDDPGFDEQATGTDVLDLHASVKGDRRRDELLDSFEPPLDRRIRDYSRGNVQKLGIVTTFMHDPDLVILDEPTSGLDPLMKQRFAEFLRAERRRGVTVFFSSHILSEVRRLCDRVGIIRGGRIVTIDPIETLLTRSGKAVRIHAARPISIDVLDLDGVHDLETSAHDHTMNGHDRATSTSDVGTSAADVGTSTPNAETSTSDIETGASGGDGPDPSATFTECAFTYTGDINALLARLPEHELVDLSIEEAPLEDVFLRFYGGEDDV